MEAQAGFLKSERKGGGGAGGACRPIGGFSISSLFSCSGNYCLGLGPVGLWVPAASPDVLSAGSL